MSTNCPDRVDAEIARRRQEIAEFSVDKAADAIWWITEEGRIRYVNEETARMLGYTREELMSMNIADIDPTLPLRDSTQEGAWEDLKQRGSQAFETIHRHKDGTEIPVWVNSSYLQVAGIEAVVLLQPAT